MYINRIIDANLNRVVEGLRVIEEYCRFVASNKIITIKISKMRQKIAKSSQSYLEELNSRNTNFDARAKESPLKRKNLKEILIANFKRAEEGLRVLEEYTGNSFYNLYRYDLYDLEKEIVLTMLKKPIINGVYLVSDDVQILKKGLDYGVSLIQLRDKKNNKAIILEKAKQIKKLADAYNIPFIINDFIDIAILVNADGLHTGQDDISVSEQRKILGPHKIIGRTSHNLSQGLKAQKEGADYVSVGPIWETPSKPNRTGIGFDYLKKARDNLNIPFVAIGGINYSNIDKIMKFKPNMVGLIRAIEDIPLIQKYFI